jgi:hypothetical protein
MYWLIKNIFKDFNKITPANNNVLSLQRKTLDFLSDEMLEEDCPIEFVHIFRKNSFQSRFSFTFKDYKKLGSDRLIKAITEFFKIGSFIPQPINTHILKNIFSCFIPPLSKGFTIAIEYFREKSTPKLYSFLDYKKKDEVIKLIKFFLRNMDINVHNSVFININNPGIIGFNFYNSNFFYIKIYDYLFNSSINSIPKNVDYDKNKLDFIFSLIGTKKTDFLISYRFDSNFSILAYNIQFPISMDIASISPLFDYFNLPERRTNQIVKIVKRYNLTFTWINLDNFGNATLLYTPNYHGQKQRGCLD